MSPNNNNDKLTKSDELLSSKADRPDESFPPFDDPAFSSKPAQSLTSATGYPKQPVREAHPEFSPGAGNNTPMGIGHSEPVHDVNEKTRHSDGQNPATFAATSPDPQKLAAGPAIAEHSKDAGPSRSGDDRAEHSPNGEPGTTDQKPRWEGPPENRPRGYLPAVDDPETDRDAAGENLLDPEKSDTGDALKTQGDR